MKIKKEEATRYTDEKIKLETVIEILRENIMLWEFINQSFYVDEKRWTLLREIITGMEIRQDEELLDEAYRYGSMLKSQDLIERQFFLWLLTMIEEKENHK